MSEKKFFMIILVKERENVAVKIQELLTKYGCIIKTRLGIHDVVKDKCSNVGSIILELFSEKLENLYKLEAELNSVKGVKAKLIDMEID